MNFAQQLRKEIDDAQAQRLEIERLKKEEAEKKRVEYEESALKKIIQFRQLIIMTCFQNNTGKLSVDSETQGFEHYNCGFDTDLILSKMGEKLKEYFIEQGFRVTYEWNAKIGGKYLYHDAEGSGYDWEDKYGPRLTLEW